MNIVELNIILYYADYLSLKDISRTVTDNCKYYIIYGTPMNAAYIVNAEPFYDPTNKYYQQSCEEYAMIKAKYGDDGITSFIDNICNLFALGCINATQMLQCIHQYDNKVDRRNAFKRYEKWINNQKYTHLIINEKGESERVECTRYVAHKEIGTEYDPEVHYNVVTTK